MPSVQGQSGNPAGRPIGSRNKRSLALEALVEAEGEDFIQKLFSRARAGDAMAIRLLTERLLPPRRERPVPIDLPRIETAEDARVAAAQITDAVAAGAVSPREAMALLRVLEGVRRLMRDDAPAPATGPIVNNN